MAKLRLPDASNPVDPAALTDKASVRRAQRPRKPPTEAPVTRAQPTAEARRALIAETAYLRAERRGFTPGHETDDWLAAEAEVDAFLKVERGSPQ